jgi:hypothetical protein
MPGFYPTKVDILGTNTGSKADTSSATAHVCYGPKADITDQRDRLAAVSPEIRFDFWSGSALDHITRQLARYIYTETTARRIDKRVERLADISCSLMSAFGGKADAGMATNRVCAVGVGTS